MIDSSCDFLIVGGLICAAIGLLIWFGAEDEAPKPENIDTLFRGNRCSTCLHSTVASPDCSLFCVAHGKAVEAHHQCEMWQ